MTAKEKPDARGHKLLLVTREFPPGPGGIGTHAFKVAQHLQALGWDVTVVSEQNRASGAEVRAFNAAQPFRVLRIPSLPLGPAKVLFRFLAVFLSLVRVRPAIVLATHAQMVWFSTILSYGYLRPVVAVGHGSEYRYTEGWRSAITRWAFSNVAGVINVSEFTAGLMTAAGIRAERQVVIPNGADAEDFGSATEEQVRQLREEYGLTGCKVILTVGLLSERKGQDIVIRALPQILAEVPGARYLIAGMADDAAVEQRYRALAAELGVAEAVVFAGRVPQALLPACYALCDVFTLTSRVSGDGAVEGYGIVAVEAALCGKPSVVSEGSGLMEAILPGETGLSVPQDDPEATARALGTLLKDDALREAMGRAALAHSTSAQGWKHRIHAYDTFLRGFVALESDS